MRVGDETADTCAHAYMEEDDIWRKMILQTLKLLMCEKLGCGNTNGITHTNFDD